MDHDSFAIWWNLHLRKARCETLSAAEQQQYESGLTELDAEEPAIAALASLKDMRKRVAELSNDNTRLRTRLAALENEMAVLERSLSKQSRELLGVPE